MLGMLCRGECTNEYLSNVEHLCKLLFRTSIVLFIFTVLELYLFFQGKRTTEPTFFDYMYLVNAIVGAIFAFVGIWTSYSQNRFGALAFLIYLVARIGYYIYEIIFFVETENYIQLIVPIAGILFRSAMLFLMFKLVTVLFQGKERLLLNDES